MSTSHVNVKTLQQKQFKVPIEPADTIANVKAKIESINGDPVANQKLLFAGKTLADDVPVEQYNLKETDFLVLMISK
ncbi:UV excision repair protein RAD23 A, partial [Tulasnella sp. 408]